MDLIVHLEEWNSKHFYDRIGLDEKMCAIHGKLIPYYTLPVKPSLDIALLVETIARMHRIRLKGISTPKHIQDTIVRGVERELQV